MTVLLTFEKTAPAAEVRPPLLPHVAAAAAEGAGNSAAHTATHTATPTATPTATHTATHCNTLQQKNAAAAGLYKSPSAPPLAFQILSYDSQVCCSVLQCVAVWYSVWLCVGGS